MNPHRKAWLDMRSMERFNKRANIIARLGQSLSNRNDLNDFRDGLRNNPWRARTIIECECRTDELFNSRFFDLFEVSDRLQIVRDEKARLLQMVRQLETLEQHYIGRNFKYLRNKHKGKKDEGQDS